MALGVWGVPRMTSDVNIAVFADEGELDRVFEAVGRAGAILDRNEARRAVARAGFFLAQLVRGEPV